MLFAQYAAEGPSGAAINNATLGLSEGIAVLDDGAAVVVAVVMVVMVVALVQ